MLKQKEKISINQLFNSKILMFISYSIFFILLVFSFYKNIFEVVNPNTFKNWQNDSESLVLGRLVKSRQSGIKADYGILQRDNNWTKVDSYSNDIHVTEFEMYPSQVGLQGFLFSIGDRFSPFNPQVTLKVFYLFNSIMLSTLILILALWFNCQFNFLSGLFVLVGSIFSPWLIMSAKNLYWSTWTMLLPFISILLLHCIEEKREEKGKNLSKYIFLFFSFLTIFIRASCGFELITAFLISIELPPIYYGVKNRWGKKRYIIRSLLIGLAGLFGFLLSFLVNMWQRTMFLGGFEEAKSSMIYNIGKRTGSFNLELSTELRNSINQPFLKIFKIYTRESLGVLFDMHMSELFFILAISFIIIFSSITWLPALKKEYNSLFSLICMTFVSISGPVSWFFLAKGHSYIHTHINFILWYFPCALLIYGLIGAIQQFIIQDVVKSLKMNTIKKAIFIISLIIINFWPAYRYFSIWDWIDNQKTYLKVRQSGELIYNSKNIKIFCFNDSLFYYINKDKFDFTSFYVHIYPSKLSDIDEKKDSVEFENKDFSLLDKKLNLPFYDEYYFVELKLPEYQIKNIETGQFNEEKRIWTYNYVP